MGPNFERVPRDAIISLWPIGGGADDWPQIVAALATRKTVVLSPGTYYCLSSLQWPSYSHLVAMPGVTVRYAVGAAGFVFGSNYVASLAQTTHLDALAVVGSYSVTVHDAAGLAIGNRIVLTTAPMAGFVRNSGFEIKNIVGAVLTLDAPVDYPYPINAEVWLIPAAYQTRDIIIEGNGMRVIPNAAGVQAERGIELVFAWNCHMRDVYLDASGCSLWGFGYDSAGRSNTFERCVCTGGGVRPTMGFVAEFQRDARFVDNESRGCLSRQHAILSSTDCQLVRPVADGGVRSICVGSSLTDTRGSTRTRIEGGDCTGSSDYAIAIGDGSDDTVFDGTSIHGCVTGVVNGIIIGAGGATATAIRTKLVNCTIVGGVTGVRNQDAANPMRLVNCKIGEQTTNALLAASAVIEMTDCDIFDSGSLVVSGNEVYAAGAGAIIRGKRTRITKTGAQVWIGVNAAVGGVVEMHDTVISGGAASYGMACNDATMRITGTYAMVGGVAALATGNATAALWVENNPQLSGGAILISHFVGDITNCNWGTWVANGVTAVVVANKLITSARRIAINLGTLGGAPAGHPYESAARVANTSFAMKAAAGDTSTYAFRLSE